jgi:glycopeptide antibiotics resistance protein
MGLDTVLLVALLMPIILIIYKIRGIRRTAGQMLLLLAFCVYLSMVFGVTGLPSVRSLNFNLRVNLMPLVEIGNNSSAYLRHSLLNILMFVPLGFMVPLIKKRYNSLPRILLLGFTASGLIELLQLFSFRITDVDDLITNTLGAVVGLLLFRLAVHLPSLPSPKHGNNRYELSGLALTLFLIHFFVEPYLTEAIWAML